MATDAEKIAVLETGLEALKASEAARISAVTVKLPPFWPDKTALWFAQAEAQFLLRGITEQKTKYAHVIALLDSKTAEQAMDIIATGPGDNAYDSLKERLTGAFAVTDAEKAKILLSMTGLGDRTPSQMLNWMLQMVPTGETPGFLFREIFLQQLPVEIQTHLAQSTKTGITAAILRELAEEADRFFSSVGARISSVSEASAEVSAVSNRLCRNHTKFGAKAYNCSREDRETCTWRQKFPNWKPTPSPRSTPRRQTTSTVTDSGNIWADRSTQ